MTKPLFKLCAVAKDESPYLAEWVFHHLHFGFDLIHVYINRTSDASVAVLERIQQTHPQVTFEFLDWVDFCDPSVSAKLQTVAYAKELALSRQQGVDWMMFLDIDELWTPHDFMTTVDQFVANTLGDGQAAPICFLWHCELGQHAPFTPLQRGAGYELSSHLKTLLPLQNVDIKQVRTHFPLFGKQVIPLDANGKPIKFKQDQPQLAYATAIERKSAYVIHRMYRSEIEYLALLLKGRPSLRQQLKLNRHGYRSHRNVSVRHRFVWPEQAFREYALKRQIFLDTLGIESLIREDKANILTRAKQAVSMLMAMLETPDRERALGFLKGTRHAVVENQDSTAPELASESLPDQSGGQQRMTATEPAPSMVVATANEMKAEPVFMAPAEPRFSADNQSLREMEADSATTTTAERPRGMTTEPLSAITADSSYRENGPLSASDSDSETRSRFSFVKLVVFSALAVFVWYVLRRTSLL